MIRVAAVGDVHVGADSAGRLRPSYADVAERADVLLLAGDLTRCGSAAEARVLVAELGDLGLPTIAVLGNHDHHAGESRELRGCLERGGVTVLEGDATVVDTPGGRLGIAGTTGFGGGFAGASGSDFGEPEMKAFVGHTKELAASLCSALTSLDGAVDARVALLHYSPVRDTLEGEELEIYPFLGSYLLADAVDRGRADLAVHGHAHGGRERGTTEGGVPVRNVAQPVIRAAYAVYCLGDDQLACDPPIPALSAPTPTPTR